LVPGEMKARLASSLGTAFPVRVAFSTVRDPVPVLGRTHPGVSTLCEAALGQAFAGQPDALFARTGAMRTDAVRVRTVLLLLRLRYTLEEEVEEFAEEIVLAAFERREGGLHWLEPLENAGREIAAAAVRLGCRSVAFTYNDPVIFLEYAIDTAKACQDGLYAIGNNRFEGKEKIETFYTRRRSGTIMTRRLISNLRVWGEDGPRARMVGIMILYRAEGGSAFQGARPPSMIADFEAQCVRVDGGLWRFQSHILRPFMR
jgi:SnoaL-like domain